MKIFIWEYVANLTNCYHSDGGLAVVAQDLEAARAMVKEQTKAFETQNDGECSALTKAPDRILPLSQSIVNPIEAEMFVFPNTGCC